MVGVLVFVITRNSCVLFLVCYSLESYNNNNNNGLFNRSTGWLFSVKLRYLELNIINR